MTLLELIGLVSALAALLGVIPAVVVLVRDRAELRELESVTSLLRMRSPRSSELKPIQDRLLDRYIRAAGRRASGVMRTIWGFIFWALGSILYLSASGRLVQMLGATLSLFIAAFLVAPTYKQLFQDVRAGVSGLMNRRLPKEQQSDQEEG